MRCIEFSIYRVLVRTVFLSIVFLFIAGNQARSNEIVIGSPDEPYWFYHTIENGESGGIDPRITRAVFAKLGYKVNFKPLPWLRLLEEAKSMEIDAILEIFKTPERLTFLNFPDEHLNMEKTCFAFPKYSPIRFEGDFSVLDGKDVGVVSGWSYGSDFDRSEGFGRVKLKDSDRVILNVAKERVHAGAGICWNMREIIERLGVADKVRIADTPISLTPNYLAFSKKTGHDDLARRFSTALKAFKKTPEFDAIYAGYGVTPD